MLNVNLFQFVLVGVTALTIASAYNLGSADGWQVAELKPTTSSQANNIKSFALKFSTAGTVPAGFKINDISCVYRGKPVR